MAVALGHLEHIVVRLSVPTANGGLSDLISSVKASPHDIRYTPSIFVTHGEMVFQYFDPQEQGPLLVHGSLFSIFRLQHHVLWYPLSATWKKLMMGASVPT